MAHGVYSNVKVIMARDVIPEIDNLIPEIVNTPNSYTRDRQKGGNIILEID